MELLVADGGSLFLNTVLNEGGINSQSDVLVVDSTQLGSASNGIVVNNFNGGGDQTIGNGILLVEVLNKTNLQQVTGWVTGNLWHEFIRDTTTTVCGLSGAHPLAFNSLMGGTWGGIEEGLTGQLSSKAGLFGSAEYNHSLDHHGRTLWGGNVGVTYALG